MAKTRHKKNEDTLLLALACGASVETAAKQCEIHERTIYRRMTDPAFKTRLQELRTDMVRRAAGLLTAAANEAVRTLLNLQSTWPTNHVVESVANGPCRNRFSLLIHRDQQARSVLRCEGLPSGCNCD